KGRAHIDRPDQNGFDRSRQTILVPLSVLLSLYLTRVAQKSYSKSSYFVLPASMPRCIRTRAWVVIWERLISI
ncbi:MAG: hypothetical protein IJ493_08635, partial [Clostridia bacterium]|nr:hypothetical protein [Clostridia bacterium]